MSEDRIPESTEKETVRAADEVPQPEGDKAGKEKKSMAREILGWVWTILAAVLIALVIRSFLFELVRVDGASMNDTLANLNAAKLGKVSAVCDYNLALQQYIFDMGVGTSRVDL